MLVFPPGLCRLLKRLTFQTQDKLPTAEICLQSHRPSVEASINQSINQSINPSINLSIMRSINQLIIYSFDQLIND